MGQMAQLLSPWYRSCSPGGGRQQCGSSSPRPPRHKSLVTYVEKNDLVGSEDFSSKFRTARRTIQMPRYVEPKEDWDPTNPSEDIPQCLKKSLGEAPCTKANMSDCMMFEQMSHEDARDWTAENPYDDYDTTYMDERIAASKESGS